MIEELNCYHAYLLRLWRAQYQGQWQWHASLESPHTGERHSFTDLEQLFDFLKERCEGQAPFVERRDIDEDRHGDGERWRQGE